jgi:hypothetical protein
VHRALQRPAVDKHRKPPQQLLLIGRKMVVAPLDRCKQRLVPSYSVEKPVAARCCRNAALLGERQRCSSRLRFGLSARFDG